MNKFEVYNKISRISLTVNPAQVYGAITQAVCKVVPKGEHIF
jgi:hypothetical protein